MRYYTQGNTIVAIVGTQSDALKLKVDSTEIVHLKAVGTAPGVRVTLAAARNGTGLGMLQCAGSDGTLLSWKAPGSSTYGPATPATTDGDYRLQDGEDGEKWVRVNVDASWLQEGNESAVALYDIYNNDIGSDDVTAGEATAGDVETYTITLENVGNFKMTDVRVWLDATTSGLKISDNGADWVDPTTAATALVMADLAPTETDTLHFQRTIAASASADAEVLNLIHARFDGW